MVTTGPWRQSLIRPIRAFKLSYLPVVMVYFAYGALGLIDVTRDLWIKESLSFTPSQLAGIGVWLTLPWTVKMVFGELVDTVPIFGSQRKSYIIIGALLMASACWSLPAPRPLAHLCSPRPTVCAGRHAGGYRHRGAGSGRGRNVHRGGAAHEFRGNERPDQHRCASSLAWCRCSAGSQCRPASWLSQGSQDGLPISCRARICVSDRL